MPWVRFDDDFYDNPKLERAGTAGVLLWMTAIAYSNRKLTDGRVSRSTMRRLWDFDDTAWREWSADALGGEWRYREIDPLTVAEHLVECGLFERDGTGYLVHDYHDYQMPASEVRRRRQVTANRVARWRDQKRKGQTDEGDV